MPAFVDVQDTDLLVAVRAILLAGCGFIARTQLAADVARGATSLPLADTSMVLPGDILDFPDADGDPAHQVVVDHRYNGTDNPVPLATNPVFGTQSAPDTDWPAGTRVVRGLYLGVPPAITPLLAPGASALYIEAPTYDVTLASQQYAQYGMAIRVTYLRRMVQPEAAPGGGVSTSMVQWALAQQWICRRALQDVCRALALNPTLITPDGRRWGIRLGDAANPTMPWFHVSFLQQLLAADLQDFGATGECTILPERAPLSRASRGQ